MAGSNETAATITVEEAAHLLRIGRSQAYAAVRRGEIPSLRIGGRLLVLNTPLQRLLRGERGEDFT